MSYKTSLIKTAIKLTPNKLIIFVGNIVLKGIAELKDFDFDIENRKAYVQVLLCGETEIIEVQIEGFAVVKDETGYKLVIQNAKSNRLWLGNLLSRIIGKDWKIPELPQISSYLDLIVELFQPKKAEPENLL